MRGKTGTEGVFVLRRFYVTLFLVYRVVWPRACWELHDWSLTMRQSVCWMSASLLIQCAGKDLHWFCPLQPENQQKPKLKSSFTRYFYYSIPCFLCCKIVNLLVMVYQSIVWDSSRLCEMSTSTEKVCDCIFFCIHVFLWVWIKTHRHTEGTSSCFSSGPGFMSDMWSLAACYTQLSLIPRPSCPVKYRHKKEKFFLDFFVVGRFIKKYEGVQCRTE